jgi:hypothetical protein
MMQFRNIFFVLITLCNCTGIVAQEHTSGLLQNIEIKNAVIAPQHKTRALQLPFIDDFSFTNIVPDINKWIDTKVYINNSFSLLPITKNVATFDALDAQGNSYYPTGGLPKYYADSLTSDSIDLQGKLPGDSIYLSFFYEPQGLGFSPEFGDSLMLYLKTNTGAWVKTWSVPGTTVQGWKQVMIAVTATNYLHNNFQFRFVNIASPNTNDDVWNIDYVRLAANRTRQDTLLNDIAFSAPPTTIFANYTAMPLRHFLGFPQEQAGNFNAFLANNTTTTKSPNAKLLAVQLPSGAIIKQDSVTVPIPPNTQETADYNFYNTNTILNTTHTIQHTYFVNPNTIAADIKSNDNIVINHSLKDYFAYDDGSAEKAYFLFAAPNTAANTALQFHLNVADSVQGLGIRFANQVPSGAGKIFSVVLYKTLGANTGAQQVIYQQDFNTVQYTNDRENFSNYKFTNAQFLDSGTYYIGVLQPANSGSDSIYFGLDMNTNFNATKLFYNVDGTWNASGTQGSLMMRPLVGGTFTPTSIAKSVMPAKEITVYPNPTNDQLLINTNQTFDAITIMNIQGKVVLQVNQLLAKKVNVHSLPAGKYFIQLTNKNQKVLQATFTKI